MINKALLIGLCLGLTTLSHAKPWQTYRGYIPSNAFRVGLDTDGKSLYVCRTRFKGSIQLGKTWEHYSRCNIAYGGKEFARKNYQLLLQEPWNHWFWAQRFRGSPLPLGRDSDGKTLYLCKTQFRGSMQPGKTWRAYNHCNIAYGGRELIRDDYKILTQEIPRKHRHPTQTRPGYRFHS